jgi:hypothetical protein
MGSTDDEDATRWLTWLSRLSSLERLVSDSGRTAESCTELEHGIPQTTQTQLLGGDPSEPPMDHQGRSFDPFTDLHAPMPRSPFTSAWFLIGMSPV